MACAGLIVALGAVGGGVVALGSAVVAGAAFGGGTSTAAVKDAPARYAATKRSDGAPEMPGGAGRPALAAPERAATFRWPLAGHPTVVTPFNPPPEPWLAGHRGVDLATTGNAAVYAAGPGRVRFAGLVAGVGVVSVDHEGGLRTTYEPVKPFVQAGQAVRAGAIIGHVDSGHPGCPRSTCLHWGLRRGDVYLDPLALLGLAPVRLLPLAGFAPSLSTPGSGRAFENCRSTVPDPAGAQRRLIVSRAGLPCPGADPALPDRRLAIGSLGQTRATRPSGAALP